MKEYENVSWKRVTTDWLNWEECVMFTTMLGWVNI